MKSFFKSLKTQCTKGKTYCTWAEAEVFDYVERFYNSTIATTPLEPVYLKLKPIQFEPQRQLAKDGVHEPAAIHEHSGKRIGNLKPV